MPDDVTILLSAAGRRPYLVRWFREALALNGVDGRILVADVDPECAASALADGTVAAPPVADRGYERWLRRTLADLDVGLALSVHDFELSRWASLVEPPASLVALDGASQHLVEDKLALARVGRRAGFRVPRTWLGTEVLGAWADRGKPAEAYVVKSRFGSGSVGLRLSDAAGLREAVVAASRAVLDRTGARVDDDVAALDHVIVQEHIAGTEHGVDVVNDLHGRYAACFARIKRRMRHGETDAAETVDAAPFAERAAVLARMTRHRGLIDADVIVDAGGRQWLIDVNPRFGGGYPSSHVAGAHVPAALVAWMLERPVDPSWLAPRAGVASAKSIEVVVVAGMPEGAEGRTQEPRGRHAR